MRASALLILATTLALAGCTAAASTADTAPTSPPPETSAPVIEEPEATALGMCDIAFEKYLDMPTYVLDISNGKFDPTTHSAFLDWAERLTDATPDDARTIVAKFLDPVFQVQSVVEAGGGALSFSTDDYKMGQALLVTYCTDAGWKLSQ